MSEQIIQVDTAVLGSGPGGYTAAFRAADLGQKVALIERYPEIGGVCLNVGCIPSKALLKMAELIEEVEHLNERGIEVGKPKINNNKVRDWKNSVIKKLTGGLKMLAKQRKVEIVTGVGQFENPNEIIVTASDGKTTRVQFKNAIIAAGSQPIALPFLPDDPRIMDSTSALEVEETNCELLVIGGGIIGLEMATVYQALGAKITVVELAEQIMPGADKDIVTPLHKRIAKRYKNIWLKTKVTAVTAKKDGLYVQFEGEHASKDPIRFDRILCAVGRKPNGKLISAEKAGVHVDERGFIPTNSQMQTNVPHIYAIGDIVGNPMLAHKATNEGRVAAECISGLKHEFSPRCIPSVAYTDPEVAWVGLTETEAKAKGIDHEKGAFPWAASGRSLSMGRDEGISKLIIDKNTHRILGAGIVGPHAGDLISEVALAIEMGCDVADVALTIHPHPTLSETIAMAAEVIEGTVTDIFVPKKKEKEQMAEWTIRRMTQEDVPNVHKVETSAHPNPWQEKTLADCVRVGFIGVVLELQQPKNIVGYYLVTVAADEAHLLNFAVHVNHQRKGYGARMLDHFIHTAKLNHLKKITLEVRASNTPAIELYLKFGFQKVGVRKDYYDIGEGHEDALTMNLDLDSFSASA